MIKRLDNLSKEQLSDIKKMVGEAFVTNELFHEFGLIEERRELVIKYMDVYTDYVYESKALYATEDNRAVIGFVHSKNAPIVPQIKMLIRLLKVIPYKTVKRYMSHIKQISDANKQYASKPHIDILFVCVDKKYQGKGYAKQLVEFAKTHADKENVPLLFDTDMEKYAQIYQHYGCELYNQKTASNGVTRYNLVWKKKMRERVMTDPKELVRMELKNAGFDIESIQVPKRVYLLADGIYDAMISSGLGEYKYPLGGELYILKHNSQVGFIKGAMCSPGIATQAEDLIAGGVEEFVHVGLAGGINPKLNVGDIVITDGAYNDTAVARLYGFDYDFIETTSSLTDEMETMLISKGVRCNRGKHWTTDAGYHETWGQILDYRSKGALCVEMEGVGLFTIALYRKCSASAIYIVTDVIDEDGWHLGWEGNEISESIFTIIDAIVK